MSDSDENVCPLCLEELDITDRNFTPCRCGYQICLLCFNQINQNVNGKCPACRSEYDPQNYNGVPPDPEQLAKVATEKKKKEKSAKQQAVNSRKHLSNVRVIQRNLVYVIGLPLTLAREEALKRNDYFGQYGKIVKVVINKSNLYNATSPNGPTVSAYITFLRRDDAAACINAVDGINLEGKILRASFGTTKYCSFFLRTAQCTNPDCMYLHEQGEEADSFTKEEMLNGRQQFPDHRQPSDGTVRHRLPPPIRENKSKQHATSHHTQHPPPPPQRHWDQPGPPASTDSSHWPRPGQGPTGQAQTSRPPPTDPHTPTHASDMPPNAGAAAAAPPRGAAVSSQQAPAHSRQKSWEESTSRPSSSHPSTTAAHHSSGNNNNSNTAHNNSNNNSAAANNKKPAHAASSPTMPSYEMSPGLSPGLSSGLSPGLSPGPSPGMYGAPGLSPQAIGVLQANALLSDLALDGGGDGGDRAPHQHTSPMLHPHHQLMAHMPPHHQQPMTMANGLSLGPSASASVSSASPSLFFSSFSASLTPLPSAPATGPVPVGGTRAQYMPQNWSPSHQTHAAPAASWYPTTAPPSSSINSLPPLPHPVSTPAPPPPYEPSDDNDLDFDPFTESVNALAADLLREEHSQNEMSRGGYQNGAMDSLPAQAPHHSTWQPTDMGGTEAVQNSFRKLFPNVNISFGAPAGSTAPAPPPGFAPLPSNNASTWGNNTHTATRSF